MSEHDYSIPSDAKEGKSVKAKKPSNKQLEQFLSEAYALHNNAIVAMQCAYLEAQYGRGVHAGMQWIENFLCGPGLIPAADEPYITQPERYRQENIKEVFADGVKRPICFCGKPAMIMGHYEGKGFTGFCSFEHERQAKAGVEALPKPQQIIIPMSRIRALMQFTDEESTNYTKYIIVQFDKEFNVMATATNMHILGQYKPGPFDGENILENILLAPAPLKLISEYGNFDQLILIRTSDNKWLCHHAEFEITFKSEDHEQVNSGIHTYFDRIQNHPDAVATSAYSPAYLNVMATVGEILNALPQFKLKNSKLYATKDNDANPALALVRFDKVHDFTAAIMSQRDIKVDGHA